MREVMYNEYAKQVLDALAKGAFLSVTGGEIDNTMTIAWGNIGIVWGKPVFTAMIRHSRYTYELLEKSGCFTVSIPLNGQLKEALKYCGTISGKEHDKWKDLGLKKIKAHKVNAPLVEECDFHYECKIIGKMDVTQDVLEDSMNQSIYANEDYHMLYYGEIVGAYVK